MVGDAIRAAREGRGWSQTELARRAGISQSHVNLLESGKRANPRADILQRLATALDMTVDALYSAAYGDMTPPTVEELHEEGLDSEFLRDLAEVQHLLTPGHRSALVEMARTLAKQDQKKRDQRRKTTPPPAQNGGEPNGSQPGL